MNNIITLNGLGIGLAAITDQLARETELTANSRDELITMLKNNEAAQLEALDSFAVNIKAITKNAIDVVNNEFTARAAAINSVIEPEPMLQAAE